MFIPIPELSPDLEWMLQSGQADTAMLAEALLKEYYTPVYRLALTLLDHPQAAQQAALQSVTTAVMHRQSYRNEMGIDRWFYRFALEVCQKAKRRLNLRRVIRNTFVPKAKRADSARTTPTNPLDAKLWQAVDGLKRDERLVVMLHLANGWQVEQVASQLKVREGVVHARLRAARLAVEKGLENAGIQPAEQGAMSIEAAISRSLYDRWPERQFSEEEIEKTLKEVTHRAGGSGKARQREMRLKETALTVAGIFLAVLLIYGVDRSLPGENATQTPAVPVAMAQAATPAPQGSKAPAAANPTATPSLHPMDYFYIVQPGDTLRIIASQLNVPVQELRVANRLAFGSKLKTGQALYIPPSQPSSKAASATKAPAPTIVPTLSLPTSLSQPYNLLAVLAKMEQIDWLHQTFWLDAQSLDLGPAGYIGPPQVRRIQAWYSQSQFLMVAGSLDGSIKDVWMHTNGGLYRANPEVNLPWFFEVTSNDMFQNPTVSDLFSLFSDFTISRNIQGAANLAVAGGDQVAGKQAVIVERKDQQGRVRVRFWVDAQTGFLLRVQQMDDTDPQIVRKDIVVTSIAFNVNFPQELFDAQLPWRGGFAMDSSGQPETPGRTLQAIPGRQSLPATGSPAGVELPKSNLTFQFPQSFGEDDPQALVEVLAGKDYLGNIMFGNPWTMICSRSPDGKQVAFVSQPFLSPNQDASLNWFSLVDKGKGQMTLGGLYVTSFAFAPDSRRLALYGYDGQFSEGGVYILDTETGKYNRLMWLLSARSLVWSPDGQSLALIGSEHSIVNEETLVLNTTTGEVNYRGPAASDDQPVAFDAPINHWGVPFPVKMGGMEACSVMPAK